MKGKDMRRKQQILLSQANYIEAFGYGAEECEMARLAGAFQVIWSRILSEHKAAIATYWEKERRKPFLELSEFISENAHATTGDAGFSIKVSLKSFRLLPESANDALHALIAHEMGHVYQFATGKTRSTLTMEDLPKSLNLLPVPLLPHGIVEFHADEMARRWGFDPVLHEARLRECYDVCENEYVRRKKPRNKTRAYNFAKKARENSLYDWVSFRSQS